MEDLIEDVGGPELEQDLPDDPFPELVDPLALPVLELAAQDPRGLGGEAGVFPAEAPARPEERPDADGTPP